MQKDISLNRVGLYLRNQYLRSWYFSSVKKRTEPTPLSWPGDCAKETLTWRHNQLGHLSSCKMSIECLFEHISLLEEWLIFIEPQPVIALERGTNQASPIYSLVRSYAKAPGSEHLTSGILQAAQPDEGTPMAVTWDWIPLASSVSEIQAWNW